MLHLSLLLRFVDFGASVRKATELAWKVSRFVSRRGAYPPRHFQSTFLAGPLGTFGGAARSVCILDVKATSVWQ
jgi:hypothetical protein